MSPLSRVRRPLPRRVAVTGTPVLEFTNDTSVYAQFDWNSVDFTGPLSICLITHRTNPGDEFDHWMLSLYDEDATNDVFWFEHSGGPVGGGEFQMAITGFYGGSADLHDAAIAPVTVGDFNKSWEIWLTWDGETDFSNDNNTAWFHWRNLTDDPTTWRHFETNGPTATALLSVITNGSLYVGGTPNGGTAYSGSIGFIGGWNADLYDNGAGHLGTNPLHTSTSDLQAIDPTSMRFGADLTSTNPASIIDLAGYGVIATNITAGLTGSIPEWNFNGSLSSDTPVSVTESLSQTEGATVLQLNASLIDALTVTDISASSLLLSRVDSWSLAEALNLTAQSSLTDSWTVTDLSSIGNGLSRTDSWTVTDSSSLISQFGVFETFSLAELAAFSSTLAAVESFTFTDVVFSSGQQLSVSGSDFWAVTDLAALVSQNVVNVTDLITGSESATPSATLAVVEVFTQAELASYNSLLSAAEFVSVGDSSSLSAGFSVSDSGTFTDTRGLSSIFTVIDGTTFSEVALPTAALSVSDLWSALDSSTIAASIGTVDSLSFTDLLALMVARATSDSFSQSASVFVVTRAGEAPSIKLPTVIVIRPVQLSADVTGRITSVTI